MDKPHRAMSSHEIVNLREQCLANNLSWLSIMGFTILRSGGLIQVTHTGQPQLRVELVYPRSAGIAAELSRRLRDDSQGGKPTVYVDIESLTKSVAALLSREGFIAVGSSTTRVALFPLAEHSAGIALRRCARDQMDDWWSIYEEGFESGGIISAMPMSLRRRVRQNPCIDHFFFDSGGIAVGVCQVIDSDNVRGVYSFTIPRCWRERVSLLEVLRAVSGSVRNPICYERVKKGRALTQTVSVVRRNLATVRKMIEYEHVT